MTCFPYHPEYGLPDSLRARVVAAYRRGDPVEGIAKAFRVSRRSILRWAKDADR